MTTFDFDTRTVETIQEELIPLPTTEVRVLATEGTASAAYADCAHCGSLLSLVEFTNHPSTWFHSNTRYRVCPGETTEATPAAGTMVTRTD